MALRRAGPSLGACRVKGLELWRLGFIGEDLKDVLLVSTLNPSIIPVKQEAS